MKILIATPVVSSEPTSHEEEWDMLMADLRDDVPLIADMPSCFDTELSRGELYGIECFMFRFKVNRELGQQLLDSAYASCPDLVIEEVL